MYSGGSEKIPSDGVQNFSQTMSKHTNNLYFTKPHFAAIEQKRSDKYNTDPGSQNSLGLPLRSLAPKAPGRRSGCGWPRAER